MSRAYFWGNFYLSSIQQGIQALHTLGNMFVNFPFDETATSDDAHLIRHNILMDWAANHKTVVIMNGGDSNDLAAIREIVFAQERFPCAYFDEEGISDALTCIGIVVDDTIVRHVDEVRSARREKRRFDFGERLDPETYELVMLIANGMMAR